jgi:hypothetical protein
MTKSIKSTNKVSDVIKVSVESKMAKATAEYIQLNKQPNSTRKAIIASFVNKCGLTSAGAATYYNTIKKKYQNQIN